LVSHAKAKTLSEFLNLLLQGLIENINDSLISMELRDLNLDFATSYPTIYLPQKGITVTLTP
jgi:hypothetical protein